MAVLEQGRTGGTSPLLPGNTAGVFEAPPFGSGFGGALSWAESDLLECPLAAPTHHTEHWTWFAFTASKQDKDVSEEVEELLGAGCMPGMGLETAPPKMYPATGSRTGVGLFRGTRRIMRCGTEVFKDWGPLKTSV